MRNTVDGGNPNVGRCWMEYVNKDRNNKKSVVILVGRWTGSMGEGIATRFRGMERALIVDSKMERLAGAKDGFYLKTKIWVIVFQVLNFFI